MNLVSVPEGQEVVAMVLHQGRVVVATQKGIYRLNDEWQLEPLYFIDPVHGMAIEIVKP